MTHEELEGRLQSVLIALHTTFSEMRREEPLRRKVRDAILQYENELAALNPTGGLLFGVREARKAMGL